MIGFNKINDLLRKQKENHGLSNMEYLRACLNEISWVDKQVIYKRVYIAKRGQFETIDVLNNDDARYKTFLGKIGEIEKAGMDGVFENTFTSFLVSNSNIAGLILYKGELEDLGLDGIYPVNLDKGKSMGILPQAFDKNIEMYRDACETRTYISFLKAFNQSEYFNGVLTVATTSPLTEDELVNLRFVFSQIITPLVLKRIQRDERDKVHEEQSHAWQYDFGVLKTRLNDMMTYAKRGSLPLVEDMHSRLSTLIDDMNDTNQFNLFINRVERSGDNGHQLTQADDNDFSHKNVSLKETLLWVLDFIPYSEHRIIQNKDYKRKVMETLVPQLSSQINELAGITVRAIPIGLKLVFKDLIYNALSYSNEHSPEVAIFIKHSDGNLEIHIVNNGEISDDAYRFIKTGELSPGVSHRLGLQSVRRIISLPFFCPGRKKWKLDIIRTREGSENLVDIFLKIPHYEQPKN